jgi:anti-sigma factor RsiW
MKTSDISDEQLTAYLDGEADPETSEKIAVLMSRDPALAERLEGLKIPLPAIRKAFDQAMDAAPSAEIEALFEREAAAPAGQPAGSWWKKGLQLAAAASVLAFAIGLTAGRLTQPVDSSEDWRVAVAEYQALYSKETLAAIEPAPVTAEASIQSVAAKVGAPIVRETLESLDQLAFKRAQILRWGSAPLAQFAFLSAEGEPFALCVTPTKEADQPIVDEELKGLATSSWIRDGVAYMVIGGSDPTFASFIAEQVRAKL